MNCSEFCVKTEDGNKLGNRLKPRMGSLPVWHVSKGENRVSLVLFYLSQAKGSFLLGIKLDNQLLPFQIHIKLKKKKLENLKVNTTM